MESVAKNKRKLTEEDLKMSKLDKFKRYSFIDEQHLYKCTLPPIVNWGGRWDKDVKDFKFLCGKNLDRGRGGVGWLG